MSAGYVHTCGVRDDGSVACWGLDDNGESTPPEGEFASVSAGCNTLGGHSCGVRDDGSVACWGNDRDGESTPPEGEFASVSAGGSTLGGYTCGVRDDGSVACWGNDRHAQATPLNRSALQSQLSVVYSESTTAFGAESELAQEACENWHF